ncbi:agmatinase family protein [Croceitalea rosinachiae]|uniref:Agmatinase family protein n=1 Tax=Croceitalea rosinachiae TaxID=3075596 RepID=A0ABU3ABB7_9FLAO|nr:agmatinase family protein [Croceitalea sp. F388]MDT0607461.1 agmatinase family protein [Croceitalea sp. F388]
MKKINLQGMLYDEKSSYRQGPKLAPPLIREAYHSDSSNYHAENGNLINPALIDDKGDFTINSYFDIETITSKNLQKNIPLLTFGGDHSITFPIIKAFHAVYGKLDILHIDAHSDLYEDFEGDTHSHACPFYNIMKNGLAENLYQVGIRTLNTKQLANAERFGVKINEMKDFESFKMPVFKNPLYLSVDIDALDPAFAPGVSHHEPGGLSTRQVIQIIQDINGSLVGADIVEYNPNRDLNSMTAMVCGKLFKEISSKMI